MAKLYTRTGDEGKTGLRSGARVSKTDKRVRGSGSLDELNSALGMAGAQLTVTPWELGGARVVGIVQLIQTDIFHIGALLAGECKQRAARLQRLARRVEELERQIDKLQAKLPQQSGFYLPGGSKEAAYLDFARAVCRRTERRLVAVEKVEPEILKYINRLSDFLYALARWANYELGVAEQEWDAAP